MWVTHHDRSNQGCEFVNVHRLQDIENNWAQESTSPNYNR